MSHGTSMGLDWCAARVKRTVMHSLGAYTPAAHGADHLLRVEKMALRFAEPGSDPVLVSMIAMLHDMEDWKFPNGAASVRGTLNSALVPQGVADLVCGEVARIGYSKRLAGTVPATPEGRAVSDADMCDVMGATGILRLVEYDVANGIMPFDPKDMPDMRPTAQSYQANAKRGMARHMFEKVLRLPDLMLTTAGRHEALTRKATDVAFLEALFREQDAPQWDALFDQLYDSDTKERN